MPSVVGSGVGAKGTGAVTPPWPAGYTAVANDIALVIVECGNTDTLTSPTGYAQVNQIAVNSGTTTKLTAIWKRLVGGDTAIQIADAGNHICGQAMIVSGVKTTGDPWNTGANTAATEAVSDTSVSCPAVTTSVINCLIVAAFSTGQDAPTGTSITTNVSGWTNASLVNVTEWMDFWGDSGNGGGVGAATGELAAAGSSGNTTATLVTANFKALMTFALEGAAATATAPILRRWDRNLGTLMQM